MLFKKTPGAAEHRAPERTISPFFRSMAKSRAPAAAPLAMAVLWAALFLIPSWACQREAKDEWAKAPKVRLKIEGWRASLDIPASSPDFNYSIRNDSLDLDDVPLQIGAKQGNFSKPSVYLLPTRENRVIVEHDGGFFHSDVVRVIDTLIVPKSYTDTLGNVIFVCELPGKAGVFAPVVPEATVGLRGGSHRTQKVVIGNSFIKDGALGSDDMFVPHCDNAAIYGNMDALADSAYLRIGTFHESAHVKYATELGKGQLAMLDSAYALFMMNCKAQPGADADGPMQAMRFYHLFKESNYFYAKGEKLGHPQDNCNELFASASTVMRFFPDKFMEGLLQLEKESPKRGAAARRIATVIASMYGGCRPFTEKITGTFGKTER